MVTRLRAKLVNEGLDAVLAGKKRSTPPIQPIFDGKKQAQLTALACSKPPEGHAPLDAASAGRQSRRVGDRPGGALQHGRPRTKKLELRHVAYRGSAPALTDLVGGQIPIVVTATSDLIQNHKAGRIRVLATSDHHRSQFLPDVPTFKEAGYPIQGTGWFGVYAPAKTPPELVERLNKALVAAVKGPQVRERFLALGLLPTGATAAELTRIQKADSELWAPAVKASEFTPDQ